MACGDYTYDSEIDDIARKAREKSRKSLGFDREYQAWEPNDLEISLLRTHPKRRRPTPNSTIGELFGFGFRLKREWKDSSNFFYYYWITFFYGFKYNYY